MIPACAACARPGASPTISSATSGTAPRRSRNGSRTGLPVLARAGASTGGPSIDATFVLHAFHRTAKTRPHRRAVRALRAPQPLRRGGGVPRLVRRETAPRRASAARCACPYGRVGYSARLGDAGEESRWFGDVGWRARPWLSARGRARPSSPTRCFEDAPESEERDLTTLFGRARVRPIEGLGLTLEVQRLENPFYVKRRALPRRARSHGGGCGARELWSQPGRVLPMKRSRGVRAAVAGAVVVPARWFRPSAEPGSHHRRRIRFTRATRSPARRATRQRPRPPAPTTCCRRWTSAATVTR